MPIKYPAWGVEPFTGDRWNILFYGFKIGSSTLQLEHINVLNQYAQMIRSHSATRGFLIVAKGNCSRSGSAAANLALSIQRAETIAGYLRPLVGGNASVVTLGHGEAAATLDGLPDGFESERHRSVLLMAVDYKKGDPPPPPKITIPKLFRRINPVGRFSVQFLSGTQGGAGIPLPYGFSVGGHISRFKLKFRDLSRVIYGDFYLTVAALKGDWGAPGSLESLGPGAAQTFDVHPQLRIWDLPGWADVNSLSLDFGASSAGLATVKMTRDMDPSGILTLVQFKIPPGTQEWEFGKYGAGATSGKGYLSIAN